MHCLSCVSYEKQKTNTAVVAPDHHAWETQSMTRRCGYFCWRSPGAHGLQPCRSPMRKYAGGGLDGTVRATRRCGLPTRPTWSTARQPRIMTKWHPQCACRVLRSSSRRWEQRSGNGGWRPSLFERVQASTLASTRPLDGEWAGSIGESAGFTACCLEGAPEGKPNLLSRWPS